MRNWFILFATTFTITTLTLTLTTWFIPYMATFNSRYIILNAISCTLLSFLLIASKRLTIESFILSALLDISVIFTIVFSTGAIIQLYPINIANVLLTLSLVIIIYIIITFIYLFILTKEAKDMNEKITDWRNQHVDSEQP